MENKGSHWECLELQATIKASHSSKLIMVLIQLLPQM